MFDAGHHLEHLAGDVGRKSGAAGRKIDRAWIGFGMGDQFRDRLHRQRWIDHQDKGAADQARDRRDVAEQAEIQLVIKRCVDGVGCRGQMDRIAVGRRTHDRLGADIAGGAGPVLDDELLS